MEILREYVQALLEGKKSQYMAMMPEWMPGQYIRAWKNQVSWARSVLQREDRIIWFLRLAKQDILIDCIQWLQSKPTIENNLWRKVNKALNKLDKAIEVGSGKTFYKLPLNTIVRRLHHYLSLPIPKIQDYIFEWQSPTDVFQYFEAAEDEWKEFSKGTIPYDADDQYTTIKEYDDGKVWLNLHRASCDREASAMGHCGNAEGDAEDETIFSLRTKDDENDRWKVHLTFVFNTKIGTFGEMKGRGNDKPAERYHPYIVDLLQMPFVKGITGGGYLPENNFHINDLRDEDLKEKLLEDNPNLLPLVDRISKDTIDNDTLKEIIYLYGEALEAEYYADSITIVDSELMAVYNSGKEFIEQFGGNVGKWFLETVEQGHVDIYESFDPSEVYDVLPDDVIDIMKENYKEENDGEEPSKSDIVDRFSDFFNEVAFDALETSIYDNIHNAINDYLEDNGGSDLEKPVYHKIPDDYIESIVIEDGTSLIDETDIASPMVEPNNINDINFDFVAQLAREKIREFSS